MMIIDPFRFQEARRVTVNGETVTTEGEKVLAD